MSNTNWNTPSTPNRQVKQEPPKIPSPTYSCMTTATTLISRPGRPPSPAPSCSTTVLFGGQQRNQISVRPLSALIDPDDQMSTISRAVTITNPNSVPSVKSTQLTPSEEIDDWRATTDTVSNRLKHIFENDNKYQDVCFEVEGGTSKEQVKAHKLLLRIASPVFDRLFEGNVNSSQHSLYIIHIKDVEPGIFKLLLKYIYTDEVDATDFDILPLLQAAKKFGVKPLYLQCVKLLDRCMTDEIAIKLCEIAASYGDKILRDAALNHIANKAFQIFTSDEFIRLSLENVHKLFSRDDLRIDEVTLFEAAIKWGENICNQQKLPHTSDNLRKVMQSLIPEIRFPLMRPDEFSLLVIPTKLLSSEEQVKIFQYMSVKDRDKLPPISFKTTPRRSQKVIELDSGSSSSDYREASSASPEQLQSLPSIPITECLDQTTTEAESETASNVSTYSGSRTKARKYERSYSSSSSSSKKRRKVEEDVKSRRLSMDKPAKPIRLNDLFGDTDSKCIKLENRTILFNDFVLEMSRHEHRLDIESIILENVRIEDSKKLDGRRVHFPRLKRFELNLHIEESISSIITETSLALEKYLFFQESKHSPWLFEKLWDSEIDITVTINKVIVLRVTHEKSHVVLNKFFAAPAILKSLKEQQLKSLVYSHTHFSDKYFPLSLHRLVILGVVSSHCMSSFLQQFKHLKELTVVSPATTVRALTLDSEFSSKDKIRKLGLGSFKLQLEPSIRFYNIVTLSLWRVQWEPYFEEKFHHTFPKLQELCIIGNAKGSSKLLRNILKIGSLTELVSWNCDFRLTETSGLDMKRFLMGCGLSEPDKSFILKKKPDKSGWSGSKMLFRDYSNYIYKKFEYEFIFEDIHTFTNTS